MNFLNNKLFESVFDSFKNSHKDVIYDYHKLKEKFLIIFNNQKELNSVNKKIADISTSKLSDLTIKNGTRVYVNKSQIN